MRPLLSNAPNVREGNGRNIARRVQANARAQSRDLCFPMHLMLGKETGETLRGEFKPMLTFFENACKNGLEGFPDMKPLTITTEVDRSAAWKGRSWKGWWREGSQLPMPLLQHTQRQTASPQDQLLRSLVPWFGKNTTHGFKCYQP